MKLLKKDDNAIIQTKLVLILFSLGLFLPTAIFDWMKMELVYFIPLVLGLTAIIFLGKIDKKQVILGIILNVLLWLFTLMSDLRFSFGETIYYLGLFFAVTLLFQIQFSTENDTLKKLNGVLLAGLNIASSYLIILGFGTVLRFRPITNLIIGGYSYYYDGLIESMTFQGKPVMMFATHSSAGFYVFIFFLLNIYAFHKIKKITNLISGILMLLLLISIRSTTSLVYVGIAILVLLLVTYFWNKKVFLASLLFSLIIGGALAVKFGLLTMVIDNLFGKTSSNGLGVRYREGGTIYVQLQRIMKSPLIGTGARSVEGTYYIDSGPVHIAQRVGLVGLGIFYLMFYRFLQKNLSKVLTIIIFLTFLSFEVGFANLLYFRTLFILPFIILFLKSFDQEGINDDSERGQINEK